ncbi:MAG: MATE family efflux transporter, partial [Lachnospiraceae bacterium]|nr:MATE family efflux transporter [Lachnospiraceae bacterium]
MNRFLSARKGFYRELFVLVIPIVVQNLISSSVTVADTLMLGNVDQTSLSASGLAGQLMFLINVMFFGLNSAITILASQYWGKKDVKVISKILGVGLIIGMVVTITFSALAFFVPKKVMWIWTDDPALIEAGAVYLRYVAPSYIFLGIFQPYISILKSCERVVFSTVISTIALLVNVVMNFFLIFGYGPFPEMGITGAAIATSLSCGSGALLCIIDFLRQKVIPKDLRVVFAIPGALILDFFRYSLPAFVNDIMWGLAFTVNSVIMGHLGSDIVAANAVVSSVRDLVTVVGFGIASAASIMLGKQIGENRLDRAKKDASSIVRVAIFSGIISGFVLLIISPFIPGLVDITEVAAGYLKIMLLINIAYQMGQIINTVLIASIFRCGGNSKFGMILDIITMWFFAVPLGLI